MKDLTGSSPEIICEDPENSTFFLEITMTEDEPGDIPAILGRSDKRSPENIKRSLGNVDPYRDCLQSGVKDQLIKCIQKKLKKDYGKDVALVIRDTSPMDWDWETVLFTPAPE